MSKQGTKSPIKNQPVRQAGQSTREKIEKIFGKEVMPYISAVRGLALNYVGIQDYCNVELYIDRGEQGESKRIFDTLAARKDEINKTFKESLSWERLDDKRVCRIKYVLPMGSFLSSESEWQQI